MFSVGVLLHFCIHRVDSRSLRNCDTGGDAPSSSCVAQLLPVLDVCASAGCSHAFLLNSSRNRLAVAYAQWAPGHMAYALSWAIWHMR
jgi:hypothetical protein